MPKLAYRSKLPRPDDPDILEPLADLIAQGVPMRLAAVEPPPIIWVSTLADARVVRDYASAWPAR